MELRIAEMENITVYQALQNRHILYLMDCTFCLRILKEFRAH
jgi:hypothetical protein